MTGYVKDTTPEGEMTHLREAFAQATAAIQAWPDATQAWQAANDLAGLIAELRGEAAGFRSWLAAYLHDYHQLTVAEMAAFMGVSPARASVIISRAKKKGNPVTEPATLPEQPHVALAVITSDRGVLIAKRRDGIPPWTFPGGEFEPGESLKAALERKVLAETGLAAARVQFIGRRIHPKTSRVMVYGHVEAGPGEPVLGDPDDLEELRWASIGETSTLMPDMFQPVRQYLDELARG